MKPSKTLIIAEMACAHDGSLEKALKIIEGACKAGADAIQVQVFEPEALIVPQHRLFPLLKDLQFSEGDWETIFQAARDSGLRLFAHPYDVPSTKFVLERGIEGLKINSSDLSNRELLELIAASGVFYTLGTGASTVEEISQALQTCQAAGREPILMHGIQNFPTQVADANVLRISLLKKTFGLPVGFQDHTDGENPLSPLVDILALGAGAEVLEKHITWDRGEKGTDYQAALEPAEFATYVQQIRALEGALGTEVPQPLTEQELQYRQFQKKSLVITRPLPKGHCLQADDLACLRADEEGLSPSFLQKVLQRETLRELPAHSLLQLSDLI